MVEEVIRAKRFEVVDDAGRPRVIIGAQAEASGLMLLDPNGQSVGELAVSDELGSTTLSLYDLRGSVRASLDLDQDGSPTLGLYDLAGEPRVSIGVAEGNTPVLDFTGPTGRRGCPSTSTRRACRASSSWTAMGTTASLSA